MRAHSCIAPFCKPLYVYTYIAKIPSVAFFRLIFQSYLRGLTKLAKHSSSRMTKFILKDSNCCCLLSMGESLRQILSKATEKHPDVSASSY